jgi:hypothetical protein
MIRLVSILAGLVVIFGLASCANRPISDFAKATPELVLEEFFPGRTVAYGIFEDRFGDLRRRFRVEIDGRMQDGDLILDERFIYDDGEQQQRIWTITAARAADGSRLYQGRAADVIGTAEGSAAGPALNWSYEVGLAIGGRIWEVRFDDWIYQLDENVALNRARVSKWGIELGTVTLVFLRGAAADAIPPLNLESW